MREVGESRGNLSKEMDIDNVDEEMWERIKQVRREEKIPLVRFKSANQRRGVQLSTIVDGGGEFYVWEMPKKIQSRQTVQRMNYVGGEGIVIGQSKLWTNSKEVMRGLRDEVRRREWRRGNRMPEEGRDYEGVIQEGIRREVELREMGDLNLIEMEEKERKYKPGILTIQEEGEVIGI